MSIYSIYVLEYCYREEHPKGAVMYGEYNSGTLKLPFSYTLIRGNGTVALVDAGHNNDEYGAELTKEYDLQKWHSPRELLVEFGITPEDVEHVFITHAHFDHMGGIALFPNAKFYIQERELSDWIWTLSLDRRFRWLMGAMDTGDVLRAVDLARQGRLVSLKGDLEDVLPGIDLRIAEDSHTAGSQYVVIRNDGLEHSKDAWVITGDIVYQFDNLDGGDSEDPYFHPIGLANGSQFNLIMAMKDMVDATSDDRTRIIPGHEQLLPQRFPSKINKFGLNVVEVTVGSDERSIID